MKIKNWAKFQHFKDRRPPWVKLYRDILDDIEWHTLDPKAAKLLVSLWLIASEYDGELPPVKTLAFRLRMSEKEVADLVSKLGHWLEQRDIAAISTRQQDDPLETEGETKTEKETEALSRAANFEKFWEAYPRKDAKPNAAKAFAKVKAPIEVLLAAIEKQRTADNWTKDGGKFIPMPATWLNAERWNDGGSQVSALDNDTRLMVEREGVDKGIGAWDSLKEPWPAYKARVRAAPRAPFKSLDQLLAASGLSQRSPA